MDVKFAFLLFTFLFVSYRSYKHFSESKDALLVTTLQKYFEDVECPAGISLYRVQRDGVQYKVQVQTRLPHNPSAINQIVKRCERDVEPGKDDNQGQDQNTCSKRPTISEDSNGLDRAKYSDVDFMTSRLLGESCKPNADSIQDCDKRDMDKTEMTKSSLLMSNSLMSYLLEVVKSPDDEDEDEEDQRRASETWSIETLTKGIFPGTLWCGFGNIADDTFGKLGEHSETDDCCRSHDLCKPIIKAFQTRYSYSNPGIVPISHCACDMDFYDCLLKVNSPTSRMIGKIFFNLVKMKCFDFDIREVCISSFLGLCLKKGEKCIAVIKRNKRFPG